MTILYNTTVRYQGRKLHLKHTHKQCLVQTGYSLTASFPGQLTALVLHFISISLLALTWFYYFKLYGTEQLIMRWCAVKKLLTHLLQDNLGKPIPERYKKLSYCRVTARCVLSVVILLITTQRCRNYLYDKSRPNRWYEVGGLVGGNVSQTNRRRSSCVYHLSTDDLLWRNFLSPQCRNCSRDPDHAHLGNTHHKTKTLHGRPVLVQNLKSLALAVAEKLHGV